MCVCVCVFVDECVCVYVLVLCGSLCVMSSYEPTDSKADQQEEQQQHHKHDEDIRVQPP